MKKMIFLLISSSLALVAWAQNGKDPVKVTDLLKIKTIGSVTLSKDGSKAAFTVTAIEPEENSQWEYKYVTQAWMVPTDGSTAPRQLTYSAGGASQLAWHPDGKKIAFVRTADGKPQIFLLSLEGGEPIQLTKNKYGAFSPRFSDDGRQLLFMANIPFKDLLSDSILNPTKELPQWSFEKPGFTKNENLKPNSAKADPDGTIEQVRAYLDNNEKDRKAKVITKLQFQEESTTSADLTFTHVYIMDADPSAKPKCITKGFNTYFNPQFIIGTTQILMEADANDSQHTDRTLESQVYIMNSDGTACRKILGKDNYTYNNAFISPSGKTIAFQHGPTSFVSIPTLAIMPVNGTEKDLINIPFDRTKGGLQWSADEKYLYFTAQSNGGVTLNRVDMQTRKVESLSDFNAGVGSYSQANDKVVFVKTEVTDPFDLYMADASGKNAKRISSFNSEWVKEKKLSFPEKFEFTNDKGMKVEYWIMKPSNYEAGKKFPLLLEIHGGPSAMWGPGESSMWHEFQFWTSKGFGVVYCNPRGSGGYGYDFLRANVNDWGKGPMTDVMTALNKTIAIGWVDTSKLAVTGGSYAGYLIGYIIGHDNRFKAACSQRGVYDLRTFFGEANAWRLVPNYFGGYPWEKKTLDILERESPINYVQNITTPYIIFHGENDLRTGVSQSEMMYKSLKVLNRPVEYVRHPGATHEITRSGNNRQRIDQMLRTWEFFQRWIQ